MGLSRRCIMGEAPRSILAPVAPGEWRKQGEEGNPHPSSSLFSDRDRERSKLSCGDVSCDRLLSIQQLI